MLYCVKLLIIKPITDMSNLNDSVIGPRPVMALMSYIQSGSSQP